MAEGLRVAAPGLGATLQDRGRPGFLRFGVSGAGAMDPDSLALANALVGNPPDAAAVEMAMLGPALVCEAKSCRVAIAGAPFSARLNGRPVETHAGLDLARGDRLDCGAPREGLRACLAVAGGFAVKPVLGSVSTHTRSRLGGLDGGALAEGDLLPLAASAAAGPRLILPAGARPAFGGGPMRVILGPQDDAFTPEAIATFLSSDYVVSNRVDRMGCNLEGPALAHREGFDIVSDGIANGSVQTPGHGRPLVLLADRQPTGGYPKIATVISADLGRLAQARPGETIRFSAVSREEAARAARERSRALARRLAAIVEAGGDLSAEFLLAANLVDGWVAPSS